MSAVSGSDQPGDPVQLARVVGAAQYHYEHRLVPVIVYWDETIKQFRIAYQSQHKSAHTIEVVRIPK